MGTGGEAVAAPGRHTSAIMGVLPYEQVEDEAHKARACYTWSGASLTELWGLGRERKEDNLLACALLEYIFCNMGHSLSLLR